MAAQEERISKIENEPNGARNDLRDTMSAVNARVEDAEGQLHPDRLIEKYAGGASCLAGALGFLVGSSTRNRIVGSATVLAVLGYAISRSRLKHWSRADDGETRPSIKEPSDLHEDWPALIVRTADNVSRIVESEIHRFENSFRSALEGHIDYALAGLAMLAMIISGTLCALVGLILYAHQWLQWWQACAIGAVILARRGHDPPDRLCSSLDDGGHCAA
jgi:hypothetical protein